MKKEHVITVAGEKMLVTPNSVTFNNPVDHDFTLKAVQYCSQEGFFEDNNRIKINTPKKK